MAFDNQYVTTPGWYFSTEDYNEWLNKHYHEDIDDNEKLNLDWFYLPYCDVCKIYWEFRNKVCSNQPSHIVSLSYVICEKV